MRSDAALLVKNGVEERLYVNERLVVIVKNGLKIMISSGPDNFTCGKVEIKRYIQNFRTLAELKESRNGVFFNVDSGDCFELPFS